MGENSGIQWTTHTMNPWLGCEKVSPECDNCYAERGSKRLAAQHHLQLWNGDRYFTSESYWKQPLKWDRDAMRSGHRARVFCASYADVFEDRPDLVDQRARLLRLILETPHLDWLLLTKRPEHMVRLAEPVFGPDAWPSNAWAGTTIGLWSSLHRAEKLLQVPTLIRFLSMEPLLERVAIPNGLLGMGAISWVIVGGESGPKARPFDVSWARDVRYLCADAGVSFFMKQMGAYVRWNGVSSVGMHWPRGTESIEDGGAWRVRLKESHGGDWDEWPEDLRIREIPKLRERALRAGA